MEDLEIVPSRESSDGIVSGLLEILYAGPRDKHRSSQTVAILINISGTIPIPTSSI